MRVGLISTYPPTECGVAAYTHYLVEALRQKNVDVYIVSHIGGSGLNVFPAFDYEDGDLPEKAFSTLVRFTPDVVHIQHEFALYGKHYGVNVIPLIIKFRLIGIPVVTTLHTVYPDMEEAPKLILQNILFNSNRIIVHDSYHLNILREEFRLEQPEHVRVIPHGAREVKPKPNAKQKLGLPRDKKVILMIGYFRPSKNFELIIDLFPEILKHYRDAILVIAGKIRGNEHIGYRNLLFQHIAESAVRDQIWLIRGQLEQDTFDTVLSAADVVVLPYKVNSQSGILAHCLAFGKPVVTSNINAMERIVAESGAGFTAANDREYVQQIVRILSEPVLCETLSQNALNYVRSKISWRLIAEKHYALYQELVKFPEIESQILVVD